ncbi:MAG: PP2C family protein-serine/threonine phosphatase [Oscillospiraceae bacterium]|jgi:sigma-B regulation protein RsbU (phosphoserine phosphatase)|nr:PP2C family protein-serine/threonine phosphatase [Oscillospiraceae bacterium]
MFKGLSRKLIVIMCLFSVALSSAIGAIGYNTYMNAIMKRYEEFAVSVLRLAHRFIDPNDMVECFVTGEKSQQYHNTQISFNTIKETTNITFLYFFTPREDRMVYFINAYTSAEVAALGENEFIVSLLNEDELPAEIFEKLMETSADIKVIPTMSGYGHMMGAYCFVFDSTGEPIGILASEIDMSDINYTLRTYVTNVLIGATMIMSVFTYLTILYFRKKITVPIQNLSESADNFVNQDSEKELKPIISNIKTKDEIETLSNSIEKMTVDMITYVNNLTAVTAEKERIGAELSVATQIQASMLPRDFPERDEFDIYAYMLPAKEVGGDFYDFFFVDNDTLAVVIADVSGKGVPAALFMVIAKTLIKTGALNGMSPKEVFEAANNLLCENNDAGMFVTAFMGFFNIRSGKLSYVNAGHNLPLIKRDGSFDWLKTAKRLFLAGMEDTNYVEEELMLIPGDELLLYTDGVTEAVNPKEDLYEEPRLLEAVNNNPDLSLKEFTELIKQDIDKFADGADQADDITMLTLRFKGGKK